MSRRLLESLNGIGEIHASGLLLRRTHYELSLWSDGSVEGRIDITGIAEAVVLAGPEALTLTIEDGRRLGIQITSSAGDIVGRGWLP